MKNLFRIFVLALCGLVGTTFADDFKSLVIPANTASDTIRVRGDQFMLIRNFTQEDGTIHGVVMVNKPPGTTPAVNVLAAAILNMSTLEVISSVVIAGPADVTIMCGSDATGSCFISYKKADN